MRENRPSSSMRGEARRSLAPASHSVRFAYSTEPRKSSCIEQKETKATKKRAVTGFGGGIRPIAVVLKSFLLRSSLASV